MAVCLMEQSQAGRETSVLLQHLIKSLLTVSSQTFCTFKTFLSPSEFPSISHQRKNEFSQYYSLRKTTPSRYTKKGGALLKVFLKHSKGLRGKREEPFSRRNWVIREKHSTQYRYEVINEDCHRYKKPLYSDITALHAQFLCRTFWYQISIAFQDSETRIKWCINATKIGIHNEIKALLKKYYCSHTDFQHL